MTIGDSSTFGWGVDEEYTYQRLLEDRLHVHSGETQTEILNLGISGHTSRHGLGMFKHYVRNLEPDVLIISYGANDARFVLQSIDEVLDVDDTWRGSVRSVLYRFASFRLLRRLILGVYDPFEASRARAEATGESRALVRAVDRDTYIDNLRSLVTQARELSARSVCAPPAYVRGMHYAAEVEGVPLVDATSCFGVAWTTFVHTVYT